MATSLMQQIERNTMEQQDKSNKLTDNVHGWSEFKGSEAHFLLSLLLLQCNNEMKQVFYSQSKSHAPQQCLESMETQNHQSLAVTKKIENKYSFM